MVVDARVDSVIVYRAAANVKGVATWSSSQETPGPRAMVETRTVQKHRYFSDFQEFEHKQYQKAGL